MLKGEPGLRALRRADGHNAINLPRGGTPRSKDFIEHVFVAAHRDFALAASMT
jgi:hypothetical protein